MKKLIIITSLLIAAVLIVVLFYQSDRFTVGEPTTSLSATPPPAGGSPTLSPTESHTPTATPNITIRVTSPTPNQQVENPITVTGTARVFEQTFSWRLRNRDTGAVLSQGIGMSTGEDVGRFNPFSFKIPLAVGTPTRLILELIDFSAKDGSVVYQANIPLTLKSQQTMKLGVHLTTAATGQGDCTQTTKVDRTVLKTIETAYISLWELLKGPSAAEKQSGYSTSIPENVKINSLRISNGTADADFSHELEQGVAGSCRVAAIRAQITNTLKQFPTIKNVVISINGRTEDILQP